MNYTQGDFRVSPEAGGEMYSLIERLYPICRSITGEGARRTLQMVSERIPLTLAEVPTGAQVFDWTIPKEWNVQDAWIKDDSGNRVVDFRKSNLHLVNYSAPFHGKLRLAELKQHLHSLPGKPEWIPYRTSYYKESWGFCLPHSQLSALRDVEYEVHIDTTLEHGSLTYGEFALPGETDDEVLVSAHICHPSLCNDNLSGIAVAAYLAEKLAGTPRRLSYRFLFVPGTIGAIAWLARNEAAASRIRHGVVLTCVGDRAPLTYKRSRRGDALVDRAFEHVLAMRRTPPQLLDFSPYGYDERQYCSPGFNMAVGCLMRSVHGTFPEYHTSADDLSFVTPESLADSANACLEVFEILEKDRFLENCNPKCEPQLGRRGLYRPTGGAGIGDENMAMLWVLNQSDGLHSLFEIAGKAKLPFGLIDSAARTLEQSGLLRSPDRQEVPAFLRQSR